MEKKIMLMVAISDRNSIHKSIIDSILPQISIKNREYVFTFIDVETDSHLVGYFKININDLPKIVVYDFNEKLFYVDNGPNDSIYSEQQTIILNFLKIINEIKNGNLNWSTGSFFEDLFLKIGIKFDQKTILYIFCGCFILLIILIIIIIFACSEKSDETDYTRKVTASNESKESNENKTDQNENKNFNKHYFK
jgi:hypothetical protein